MTSTTATTPATGPVIELPPRVRDEFRWVASSTGWALLRAMPVVIVAWICGQLVAHRIIGVAVDIGAESEIRGLTVLAGALLVLILASLIALRAVGRALMPEEQRDGPALGSDAGRVARARASLRELIEDTVTAALPFLVVYGAWGMANGTFGEYRFGTVTSNSSADVAASQWQLVAAAGVAYAVQSVISAAWMRKRWIILGVLSILAEALWLLYAIVAGREVLTRVTEWITSRRAWDWITAVVDGVTGLLARLVSPIVDLLPAFDLAIVRQAELRQALIEPVVWLAIAIIVVERGSDQWMQLNVGERIRRMDDAAMQRITRPVRWLVHAWRAESAERWVPLFSTFWVLRRMSLVLLAILICAWSFILTGGDLAVRGFVLAHGADDPAWWPPALLAAQTIRDGAVAMLQVVLAGSVAVIVVQRELRRVRPEVGESAAARATPGGITSARQGARRLGGKR